jgi:hypothetical protein
MSNSNFDYAKATEKFVRALGNGETALKEFDGIVQAVVTDRNTGHISDLLSKVEKKKDSVADGVIRFIVGQIFKGAKSSRDKKTGRLIIKIQGVQADAAVVGRLSKAAQDGLSLRSKGLRKFILEGDKPKEASEKPAIDYVKKAQAIQKSGVDLDKMIAALQALKGVNGNTRESDAGIAH